MKSSNRPSRRPLPEIRGSSLAFLLLALLGVGCVTRGTHGRVVAERDRLAAERERLAERVELLEASNESLSSERVDLIDRVEDLRLAQEELASSVKELERRRSELETALAEREAALAQRSQEIDRLRGTYEGLVEDLEAEVQAGQIQIERLREGLRLNVSDEILFPSGSAELSSGGREVLARVAGRLRDVPDLVEVQGHTDDVPISTPRYPSNWELAASRATGVVRWLEAQGVTPDRLSGVSFGEHHPVAPNDSPANRARNRRIEIILLPVSEPGAEAAEESPAAPGG